MTQQEAKQTVQHGRDTTYNAVIYALGAVLGDLATSRTGARLAEELHKEFGRHLGEFLHSKGISYERGATPEETVKNILGLFVGPLGFGRLEHAAPTPDRGTHGVWKDLLGTEAYAELEQRYADPFLACPLNAIIRYELEKDGATLRVHGCSTELLNGQLESWEEVVEGTHFLEPAPATSSRS